MPPSALTSEMTAAANDITLATTIAAISTLKARVILLRFFSSQSSPSSKSPVNGTAISASRSATFSITGTDLPRPLIIDAWTLLPNKKTVSLKSSISGVALRSIVIPSFFIRRSVSSSDSLPPSSILTIAAPSLSNSLNAKRNRSAGLLTSWNASASTFIR